MDHFTFDHFSNVAIFQKKRLVLTKYLLQSRINIWFDPGSSLIKCLHFLGCRDIPYKYKSTSTPCSRKTSAAEMQDRNPTSLKILKQAEQIGKSIGLKYIYLGNAGGPSNTYCKTCGKELIERVGYFTRVTGLNEEGKCIFCGTKCDGVSKNKPLG